VATSGWVCGAEAESGTLFPAAVLNGGDGIRNGDFSKWIEGQPLFWTARASYGEFTQRVEEGGNAFLGCAISGGSYTTYSQHVDVQGSLDGRTLRVTCRIRTRNPEAAGIVIILDNDERLRSDYHPGDDAWHDVVLEHTFESDYSPKAFNVVLLAGNKPRLMTYFDDVTMSVE